MSSLRLENDDNYSQNYSAVRKRIQRAKLKKAKVRTVGLDLSQDLISILTLASEARGVSLKTYIEQHLRDHFLQSDFLDLLEGLGDLKES